MIVIRVNVLCFAFGLDDKVHRNMTQVRPFEGTKVTPTNLQGFQVKLTEDLRLKSSITDELTGALRASVLSELGA